MVGSVVAADLAEDDDFDVAIADVRRDALARAAARASRRVRTVEADLADAMSVAEVRAHERAVVRRPRLEPKTVALLPPSVHANQRSIEQHPLRSFRFRPTGLPGGVDHGFESGWVGRTCRIELDGDPPRPESFRQLDGERGDFGSLIARRRREPRPFDPPPALRTARAGRTGQVVLALRAVKAGVFHGATPNSVNLPVIVRRFGRGRPREARRRSGSRRPGHAGYRLTFRQRRTERPTCPPGRPGAATRTAAVESARARG